MSSLETAKALADTRNPSHGFYHQKKWIKSDTPSQDIETDGEHECDSSPHSDPEFSDTEAEVPLKVRL
jgi:hypothetical protein